MRYILEKGEVKEEPDLMKWARWYEKCNNRHIHETYLGKVQVSTVFLGINHCWDGGPPLIFETMIFGGEHDEYQDRCSTIKQAKTMHDKAVKLVTGN